MNLFCANGSIDQFDTIFRTNMDCGIYRMDSCLARYTCQRADINFICEKSKIIILDFYTMFSLSPLFIYFSLINTYFFDNALK